MSEVMEIRKQMPLLPHQMELMMDTTTQILGMCSGFGGGKSFSAARKAVQLLLLNPGCDGIVTEPTYPLLTQIMVPELKTALEAFEVPYRYNKVENIFYCVVEDQPTRIICASMENYSRLIGINAAWIVSDEFDTTKHEVAIEAFRKLIGRIRRGKVRQFVIVSTPEGYRAMYQIFVLENNPRDPKYKAGQKRLIKARTYDNHHLPADYIERMESLYPGAHIKAYLNGEFTNLTQGSIYHEFSRELNKCDTVVRPGEDLHIGQDFNVGKQASCVCVKRIVMMPVAGTAYWDELSNSVQCEMEPVEQLHVVDEFFGQLDTKATIKAIQDKYQPEGSQAGDDNYHTIHIYPDASGRNRKTNNASTSDIAMLEEAGFYVHAGASNPAVQDRILSMNSLINNARNLRRLLVNPTCETVTNCLERQVYNEKTGEPEKGKHDHMNDALGYVVNTLYPVLKPMHDDVDFDIYG